MARTKLESAFRSDVLYAELDARFPGHFRYNLDPLQMQGIPDLLILWGRNWGILETKRETSSAKQVNQDYYVEKFGKMSFSAFINADNYLEVLDDMERAFSR